ncbi:hypothetical protein ACFSL6_25895, partial [Paenibacillus thailandensis]
GGRYTGLSGNLIWLHGLGFHALQAVPFAAWLAARKNLSKREAAVRVHWTGIAYILGLAAVGWQTMLGVTVLQWSALPLAALVCFIAAAVPVVQMLAAAKKGSYGAAG